MVSNVNSMDPEKWNSGDWVGLAVAEDLSKVPRSLRCDLSRMKLQLVVSAACLPLFIISSRLSQ